MKKSFIDKNDNIRAEFPLLEANLPSYSFLSMDYIMPMCPSSGVQASKKNENFNGTSTHLLNGYISANQRFCLHS